MERLPRTTKKLLRVMAMLTAATVLWMYPYVKTREIVLFKYVAHVGHLDLNKAENYKYVSININMNSSSLH